MAYLCGPIFLKINPLNASMLYVGIWHDDYSHLFDYLIRKKSRQFLSAWSGESCVRIKLRGYLAGVLL